MAAAEGRPELVVETQEEIQRAGEAARDLVTQLLAYSGRGSVVREVVDVAVSVREDDGAAPGLGALSQRRAGAHHRAVDFDRGRPDTYRAGVGEPRHQRHRRVSAAESGRRHDPRGHARCLDGVADAYVEPLRAGAVPRDRRAGSRHDALAREARACARALRRESRWRVRASAGSRERDRGGPGRSVDGRFVAQ